MEKINWKAKLTSRKFWAAVVSFVALLVVAFGGTQEQATQITALIMAGATVVAYIIGEGMIDAASAGATVNVNGNPVITGVNDESTSEKIAVPATPAAQTAAESGAVAPVTNGAA